MYDPVGAFKDVFGGVQGVFAGLTGAAKISGAPSSEPSSQTVRSSKAPVRFILGRASTGGVLAWVQEQSGDQTSGEWIHIVYVLSEGAIAGVDEIYVDERPLSELGANATSEVTIDPAQVNAFLLANCPDWRQEQIGRGLSFVRLSFKYDAEKFPSGIPDVRFVVRGRSDVYDPRSGVAGYSANTALLILWYLRNRCAIPDDEIIFQSFASAANVCDETVIGPDGKMSPRYFAGAVIGADEKRNTVLDNLLSACAGTLIRVGGRWSLQVGAYYGPADFTINEDMVIGTVEGTTEVSNSDAINTMRGTFVDPAQAWAETDYPEVAIQDWIAADGGELAESQSFAYVTDAYLAQRLANISLRRRRSGGSLSVPLNFNGYNCRPGRAVKVDLPSLNILGEFMVTEWTMGAADACKVTLKPYEQAVFDDAVGQPYDPLGFINLPVGGLAAVTGLAWTPSGVAEVVQGVLSWAPPGQTVLSYTVTIRKGAEVVQSLKVGGEASSCNINGLTSGTYAMSVVAFGPGTRSGEATINVNVGGPPVPESCAVYASVDTITLVPANLQNSLNGGTYEYFYATNPSAPIADAVYLGQGLTFTHTGLAFAKEYSYYVRSANAYGKSDFLYVLAATSSDPTQMLEVIAGQITESELGQELTKRIDLIDMNGPGSVNERLGEVRSDLNQQIADTNNAVAQVDSALTEAKNTLSEALAETQSDLQEQIDQIADLADSMPYKPDQAYTAGQGVLGENGKLYQAKGNVPAGNPPPNAAYWTDIGEVVQTANGLAVRVQTVETKVQTLEGTTTAQSQQITGLQSGLTTTNQNVSAAQAAADAANTLAGGKGKVIVQSAAPAAADRLAQNLWIDTTGNANTPKRWNGSAWVAVTDKVATDAAAAAANALAVAQTKADASAVQSLTTKVTDVEGAVTAQGQSLTGLQSSLTTTNQNVTAAQQAALDAATLAGGKGKVIVQSAAPAVADRLAQNLWIDTTNNANTPKRWSGSAWVAVTDKVATDAAAAAANALTVAQSKADATAVNNLTTRVTDAEGSISAQGQSITGLQGSLTTTNQNVTAAQQAAQAASDAAGAKGKVLYQATAPAVADRLTQNLWIDTTGNANTPKRWNGTAWVAVTDKVATDAAAAAASAISQVATKADASAVQALTNRVSSAEGVLTSQSSDITQLKNGLSAAQSFVAGKAWEFTGSTRGWFGTVSGSTFVAGPLFATSGNCPNLQCNFTPTFPGAENPFLRIRLRRRNTARSGAQMYWANEDGGLAEARRMAWTINTSTTDWQDIEIDLSGHAGWNGKNILAIRLDMMSASDTTGEIDIAYIAVGRRSIAASAEAVSSLSSAVSDADGKLTSQGQSIVSLQNGLTTTNGNVTTAQQAAQAAATAAGAKGEVIYGSTAPAADKRLAQNLWIDTTGNANTPKRWNGSAWVAVTDKVATDAAAAAANALSVAQSKADASVVQSLSTKVSDNEGKLTTQGQSITGLQNSLSTTNGNVTTAQQAAQAASTAAGAKGEVIYGSAAPATDKRLAQNLWIDTTGNANTPKRWSGSAWVAVTDKVANDAAAAAANALTVAQSKADASTVQSLTNAVTQQGQDLIAQGQALTAIDVSIGDAGGENLLYNPAFTKVNMVDPNVPDGWTRDGAAPNNSSMVESWLNAGERAFRSAVTGVTSGSPYLSLIPASTRRVKVGGSQTVTSSIYARRAATSGLLSLRLYFQWLNASGVVISAPFSTLNPISVDGSRHTLTAVAPADAVAAVVYYRVHASTTTATNGTFELARPQVEYGSRASGWRDSGQVNAANNAATSTAVENLTSTVNQQGDNLSSVAGRTTSLENGLTTTNQNVTTAQQAAQAAATAAGGKGEVIYGSTAPAADKRLAQNLWIDTTGNANTPKRWNGSTWVAVTDKVATDAATAAASALSQVATKAEASAVNSLTNRVSNAEGTLSSNSSDITQLKNSIGTAQPFVAGKSWEFIGSTLGWVGTISGSTFTAGPLFATAGKCPNLQCNFTPAIVGAENPYLRIRLRRRNTTRSGAQMYWANEDGGLAEARRMAWAINITTNDWQDIEFDLSGHTGWNGKRIIAIRLDMMSSADTSGEIDIAYIAVGRRSAAASAQAVASLESNVTQQGDKLTAEGKRIDGLYTAVGDANAAIQNEATARTNADTALSQQIQTTQSSLGDTNASVQQISTAQTGLNNRVNAQYSIKVAVTQSGVYALGGIGVGIQNQNGVLQSVVAVLADRFAVINAAGDGFVSPFAVQGGQVFMNDAFIRDASITNAKIANAAITAAKIGEAEVDTLRIRGNAVSVPVSANNPGNVVGIGVGQWQNLIAVGVQMDEGGFITAQYSCYQGFGSGIRKYQFQMDINGLVIAQGGGDWADSFPNLMGSIGVGPGYFVITVKWWGENSGVSVQNHTLYAMGTKR
ncbi:phage tail protein [Pseudomonas juntendi]|uniref:phage tail protein n=1 Tax=Pseudomonas juntendi TaxID=2666183 RepID=UPI001F2AD23C|nr:DUF1983 domain-containing protein [Pseudomonas juntendi]